MAIYCRLCAELKDADEIAASITDAANSVEQKLTMCCQWNVEHRYARLPQEVCTCCLDKLDKFWLFSQSVQSAQDKLKAIFDSGIGTDSDTKELTTFETIEVSFDCTMCLNSFSSRIALKAHECNRRVAVDQCSLCHKTFKSLEALRFHCEKQNEYACPMCSKIFCRSNALKKHKQQGCENPNLEREVDVALGCNIDDIKVELSEDIEPFAEENPLLVPIESNILTATSSNHGNKSKSRGKYDLKIDDSMKYDCYLCNQRFRKCLFLKRHMESHTLPKTLECDHCHTKFRSERSLRSHRVKHKPGVPPKPKVKKVPQPNVGDDYKYQCYLCKKKFARFEYVKTHMLIHSVPKTLECDYCHIKFRTRRYLTQHNRLHIDFTCDVCHKQFPSERTLKLHKRVHVGDSSKLYGCQNCDQFFKDLSTYCQHMKARHGMERPDAKKIAKTVEPNGTAKAFVCEQCGKDFREEWSLKNHSLVHSEVRDHQCDVCSKGFKSKYTLDAHMVVHRDEKKFKCQLCGNAYNRKASLALHLEIHARGVKKVPCDLCDATFLHKSEMIEHRSTHTGDRVYRCDICNYATRHRGDIGKHNKRLSHLEKVKELSELHQ